MTLEEYKDVIIKFLKDYLDESHCNGYVLGLSGGIDSAVCAGLLSLGFSKEKIHLYMLPISSNPNDVKDAIKVADKLGLDYKICDLEDEYTIVKNNIISHSDVEINNLVLGNIKARLRMVNLYAYAQSLNCLVVGTDNKDETYTGYFTKYGDGAADIFPLRHLLKEEIFALAKMLDLPIEVINKAPSAGLSNNQTDEDDLGVTYKELDAYLRGEVVNESSVKRIEHLHKISAHKREKPAEPIDFIRK